MGGNLFPNSDRIQKSEMSILLKELEPLKAILQHYDADADVKIPKMYSDKESFGDLDVIIKSDKLYKDPLFLIDIVLKPRYREDVKSNDHVYSTLIPIGYKKHQVDFIVMPQDCMWEYYDYNDLPIFLGILFRNIGLKYSPYGLFVQVKTDDGKVDLVKKVSDDYNDILNFLELDKRTLNDKATKKDVFDFVISAKFFHHSLYGSNAVDSMNKDHRHRFKKRPVFIEFCEYTAKALFDKFQKDKDWVALAEHTRLFISSNKYDYIPIIQSYFKNEEDPKWLENLYKRFEKELELNARYKEKFNGNIVSSISGLEGTKLGALMKFMRSIYDRDFILSMNSKQLEDSIKACLEIYDVYRKDN